MHFDRYGNHKTKTFCVHKRPLRYHAISSNYQLLYLTLTQAYAILHGGRGKWYEFNLQSNPVI